MDYFIPIPRAVRESLTRKQHERLSGLMRQYYSTEGGDQEAREKIDAIIREKLKRKAGNRA